MTDLRLGPIFKKYSGDEATMDRMSRRSTREGGLLPFLASAATGKHSGMAREAEVNPVHLMDAKGDTNVHAKVVQNDIEASSKTA